MATSKPRTSELRKLEPTVAFPSGAVLRKLSAADAQWLRRRLLDPIECVYIKEFDARNAEKTFLKDVSEVGKPRYTEVPDYSRRTEKAHRNLTLAEEAELFNRFNYFRHRTMLVLAAFAGKRLTLVGTREVLRWDVWPRPSATRLPRPTSVWSRRWSNARGSRASISAT